MRPLLLALLLLGLAPPARAEGQAEAAIQALRRDGSLKVRTQAAIVLGQRGAGEAVPALRQAVAQDEAAAVRLAAVAALAKLSARAARPTFKAASLADPDAAVRDAAARALEALGPVTVALDEPAGPPALRGPAREALGRCLRQVGLAVEEAGELRLRTTASAEASPAAAGQTQLTVRLSLVASDADGHLDALEASGRVMVPGPISEARLGATSARAVDAVARTLCEDLADRLGRR